MGKKRVLNEMLLGEMASSWALLNKSDDAIEKSKKDLLKQAKEIAETAKKRLLGMGFKTKNLSVYLDFNQKPAYQFHLVDMRYDDGRTSEQALDFMQGAVGHGGAMMPRAKAGEYDLRFEHGKS
jgi:hypothetical protein